MIPSHCLKLSNCLKLPVLSSLFLLAVIRSNQVTGDAQQPLRPLKNFKKSLNEIDYNNHEIEKRSSLSKFKWNWATEIRNQLEVRCEANQIQIFLHHDPLYTLLPTTVTTALKAAVLKTASGCSDHFNDAVNGAVRLDIPLTGCATQVISSKTSLIYTNTIQVSISEVSSSDIIEHPLSYSVRCDYFLGNNQSNEPMVEAVFDHEIGLYSDRYTKIRWTVSEDRMDLGTLLFVQGSVQQNDNAIVHSFPADCWTSSQPAIAEPKKYFLIQGCPVDDQRGKALSFVSHVLDRPNRVGFRLGNQFLFSGSSEVFIHCEFLSCLRAYTNGIYGIPKCPISHYCAHQNAQCHKLPDHMRKYKAQHAVTGPFAVNRQPRPTTNAEHNEPANRNNCQQVCAARSMSVFRDTIIQQGIHLNAVVAIAFASFLLGILLVGGLWLVHTANSVAQNRERHTADFRRSWSSISTSCNSTSAYRKTSVSVQDEDSTARVKLIYNHLPSLDEATL